MYFAMQNGQKTIILLYVDDITITENYCVIKLIFL